MKYKLAVIRLKRKFPIENEQYFPLEKEGDSIFSTRRSFSQRAHRSLMSRPRGRRGFSTAIRTHKIG